MKKLLFLTAAAFILNASAVQATPILDDSASFAVARAVKLGDGGGDYGTAPTVSAKKSTNLKKPDCKSDADCSSSKKCAGGKCASVCTDSTCSGETPDCSAESHKAVCKCTENSCGSGKKCSDGKCVPCSVGDKCGCSGEKVIVSGGKCGCPASATCPAGQYKTDDCSCRNCIKDNTYDRCGCVAPLVPNGSGGCYCKETTCAAGNSFSSSACGCVPCTDNASCRYPCPNGQVPNGTGGCASPTPTICEELSSDYYTKPGSWTDTCVKFGGVLRRISTSVGYCFTCGDMCTANCSYCQDDVCTACASGYVLKNGVCVALSCTCTSASNGTYSGEVDASNKVAFSPICTRKGNDNGCLYEKIKPYILLNSDHSSVVNSGDTLIRCASTSTTSVKCSHVYEPATTFTVTFAAGISCPSGYSTSTTSCKSKQKLVINGYSNGKACGMCVDTTCKTSGYFNGTSCSSFSTRQACALEYKYRGEECARRGETGKGICDVDSLRRCCEYCTD